MRVKLTRLLAWLPALVIAAALYWSSSREVPDLFRPLVDLDDKAAHAVAFGVLALAVLYALRKALELRPSRACLVAAVVAALYGVSDEWHQLYVPGRSGDWLDVFADAVGSAMASGGAFLFYRRQRHRIAD